ncbi:MAG TPA: ABC transporter ATP-binding protein [Thermoanaerobaculia bacterium]
MIHVHNVTKALSGKRVLDDVTFDVTQGRVALLGRNGAGKTTLMRLLTGLWKPDAGTIRIGEHDLATHPVQAKQLLGFQPEFPELHPTMRPRELLDFVAATRGVDYAETVERLDAAAILDKRSGSLSQGQRRLVTLIAALMHAPPVLLLDEPTNALDPHRVAALKQFLGSPEGPRAALISTHQLDFVATVAERFILIAQGKIVADGNLAELRAQLGMPAASLEELVVRAT